MSSYNDIDSLIEDIEFLQTVEGFPGIEPFFGFDDLFYPQYLTDPAQKEPEKQGQPFPGFELPEEIIPEEINIPLNPIAWILCDNGLGQIVDFISGIFKGFLSGIKFLLDGIVSLVKSLVDLIKRGFNEVVKALKYTVRMLKEFYCASQHIRFVITKAAPITRPDAGLEPLDPDAPRPPKPQIYPTKPDSNGQTPDIPDPNYQEIFNALLRLKGILADSVPQNISQVQENENARYEDLRAQLIYLIPTDYRDEYEDAGKTEEQKQIDKAKAEKQKYIEGLEDAIAQIERQIKNLTIPKPNTTGNDNTNNSNNNTGGNGGNNGGTGSNGNNSNTDGTGVNTTPSTGVGAGGWGSDGVTVTPSTGVGLIAEGLIYQGIIADLPPMEPIDTTITEVVPNQKGATKQNVLDLIELIINQGAIKTSNNILIVGSNNRLLYRSLRSIIDTVRETQQKQRLKEERDRQEAERKRQEEERKQREANTLILY